MAEHPWQPADAEVERALADLAAHVAYPLTPDLDRATRARLLAGAAVSSRRRQSAERRLGLGRRGALIVVALLTLAGALFAATPGVRTAVARLLGVPGIILVDRSALPAVQPTPAGRALGLGRRILLPSLPAVGAPDEVYLDNTRLGGHVTVVYRARRGLPAAGTTGIGLLLTEFVAAPRSDDAFYAKGMQAGTSVETVTVNGALGFWISGHPHDIWTVNPATGAPVQETLRLASNTLLWQQNGLTLRLESALPKAEALHIAGSIR